MWVSRFGVWGLGISLYVSLDLRVQGVWGLRNFFCSHLYSSRPSASSSIVAVSSLTLELTPREEDQYRRTNIQQKRMRRMNPTHT